MPPMKRFWTNAEPNGQNGRYQILLDTRPVKLPSGAALDVPFAGLAKAIAQEWGALSGTFTPDDLPLTQLVCTALERVSPHRAEIIQSLGAYGLNDLLCYRADTPPALIARQHEQWDPWLQWLERVHNIALITTNGLMPVNQLPWTSEKITALLSTQTDYELAALGVLIPALGSFVLGLAVAQNVLSPELACEAAALDEIWQAEQWSEDPQDKARRQSTLLDVKNVIRFLSLIKG